MRACWTLLLLLPASDAFVTPGSSRNLPLLRPRLQNDHPTATVMIKLVSTLRDTEPLSPRGRSLFSEKPKLSISGDGDIPRMKGQEIQTLGYVLTSLAYLAIAGVIFLMPDKTNTAKLDTKLGGACGFALASFISNILAQASNRNRLDKQDAYKKLNLGLLAFCTIGIFAVPGEAEFTPLSIPANLLSGFMSMVRVIGGATAYFGWRAGVKKNVVEEIAEGVKTTKESMDLEKKSKGWFYQYATVFVGFGVLSCMMIIARSKLDFDISLEVSAISRLALIASMFLTLKDANDKDQLAGKTFVQMNFVLAAWAFIVGIGQGLQQATFGFSFDFRKAKMIFCALPFFFKAMKGQKDATTSAT